MLYIVDEIWRDVVGFEGRYKVSNKGRIKSLCSQYCIGPKKLQQKPDGYLRVNMVDTMSKIHTKLVHRLVAEAFKTNPHNLPCVMHKNKNILDNRPNNLRYATKSEVALAARRNKNTQSLEIKCYNVRGKLLGQFGSVWKAAKHLRIGPPTIYRSLEKNKPTMHGYMFKLCGEAKSTARSYNRKHMYPYDPQTYGIFED